MAETTDKIKHLWLSNSPHSGSGYGVETRDLLFRFIKAGYDFSCTANYGIEGYPVNLYGEDLIDDRFKGVKLTIYPKMGDQYGGDALVEHSRNNGFKVAYIMLDLFAINPQFLEQLNQMGVKFCPYLPIDQEPISPGILNNLRYAYKIITFSQFGQKALEKEGFASHLIPEGIDLEIFKPMDKQKMRDKYGLPQDAFMFGMVAANKENPPRKSFQQVLEAFALFYKNHPEAAIFFHSQQNSPAGFPILEYARHLGVADRIYFINPYKAVFGADSKVICEEINCMDVYLNPSSTEGFGMGMVESQACGKVVIGNRCQSMPELVVEGKTGLICETDRGWWRNLMGFVYPPNVDSLYEKMEESFKMAADKDTADLCRKNIMDNYNIDTLVETKWKVFLDELETEIAEENKK